MIKFKKGRFEMYILAILCPPIAVLLTGKPIQAVLNLFLSLLFYFPGLIHAMSVVGASKADKRVKRQTKAIIKSQQIN